MIDAHYPQVMEPETKPGKPIKRRFTGTGIFIRLSCLILCVAFCGGFAFFTMTVTQMKQAETVSPHDAIIVLTGGTDRLKPAFALLKNGFGKKLLISGVNPNSTKKEIVEASGVKADLAACCLDLDQIAANTVGNARESAKWLRANGFSSVILVTSNYHMPRAKKELQRLAGKLKITPYPVVNSDLRDWKWLEQPDAFRLILTEYLKTILTTLRHLSAPHPENADLASAAG